MQYVVFPVPRILLERYQLIEGVSYPVGDVGWNPTDINLG